MIRDLLNPGSGYLDLREDAKGVQVTGLTTLSTRNLQQVCPVQVLRECCYTACHNRH